MNDLELTYLFHFLEEHDIDSIIRVKENGSITYTVKYPDRLEKYVLKSEVQATKINPPES